MAEHLSEESLASFVDFIIRPPRHEYSPRHLGPTSQTLRSHIVHRTDFELVNNRGLTLQCSIWEPQSTPEYQLRDPLSVESSLPFVVYLHGNGSCRLEAWENVVKLLVPYGLAVFAFDFSGSGMSEGKYITLGYYEKDDVQTVVEFLKSQRKVEKIALWGHSMGAATAIMYAGQASAHGHGIGGFHGFHLGGGGAASASTNTAAAGSSSVAATGASGDVVKKQLSQTNSGSVTWRQDLISCMICDSAYCSFDKLADTLVDEMQLPAAVPKRLVLTVGVRYVKKAVKEKAGFSLDEIDPQAAAKKCTTVPVLLVHGTDDNVVHVTHSDQLIKSYACDQKELIRIEGAAHDSIRPSWVKDKCFVFLMNYLTSGWNQYYNLMKAYGNDLQIDSSFARSIFVYTELLTRGTQEYEKARQFQVSKLNRQSAPAGSKGNTATTASGLGALLGSHDMTHDNSHVSKHFSIVRNPHKRASVKMGSKDGSTDANASGSVGGEHIATSSTGSTEKSHFGFSSFFKRIAGRKGHQSTPSAAGLTKELSVDDGHGGKGKKRQTLNTVAAAAVTVGNERAVGAKSVPLSGNSTDNQSVSFSPAVSIPDSAEMTRINSLLVPILGNRSMAYVRTNKPDLALADAEQCLKLDPTWVRGYQRKAQALMALKRFHDVGLVIEAGLVVDANFKPLFEMKEELRVAMEKVGNGAGPSTATVAAG